MTQGHLNQPSGSNNEPTWCEEQQIYINGTIASSTHAEEYINAILSSVEESNTMDDKSEKVAKGPELHIFGYGSLCWNPGSPDEVLANPKVRRKVAKAIGWKRCWCQQSTDHRGDVSFPGLVCTLLSDEEISNIKKMQQSSKCKPDRNCDIDGERKNNGVSMTEGVLYTIPSNLIEQCLAELDFREKGGYARDVIDVLIEEGSQTQCVKALLYRGTPDNPAFSKRALLDMYYAASIMAVAEGPSGRNDAYLYNLDKFLSTTSRDAISSLSNIGDQHTKRLAALTHELQSKYDLYFLFGAGSNQHNQLLLSSTLYDGKKDFVNAADLVNGEDVHELTDIVLATPKIRGMSKSPVVKSLYAGGGHSAMLTDNDDLYLWGWNENGQLGRTEPSVDNKRSVNERIMNIVEPLGIKVGIAALGQSHTLIIEKSSKKILSFGDDSRGQVSGTGNKVDVNSPVTPLFLQDDECVAIAAGVFHSAAITKNGELVTWGCRKFSQCLQPINDSYSVGRWRPEDGSRLVQVACGRRHTTALDEHGRLWTMGENKKYGQLGRSILASPGISDVPQLVNGILGEKGSGCVHIDSGWSHNAALVKNEANPIIRNHSLFAWGRCDKFQFGKLEVSDNEMKGVDTPTLLKENLHGDLVELVVCGSESLLIVSDKGKIYGCGWNEHGNVGVGESCENVANFEAIKGSKIRNYGHSLSHKVVLANGGAHFLICMI